MLVNILKAFPYGADGVNAVHLAPGETHEIRDDLVRGLIAEGYVSPAGDAPKATKVEPPLETGAPVALDSVEPAPVEAHEPAVAPRAHEPRGGRRRKGGQA